MNAGIIAIIVIAAVLIVGGASFLTVRGQRARRAPGAAPPGAPPTEAPTGTEAAGATAVEEAPPAAEPAPGTVEAPEEPAGATVVEPPPVEKPEPTAGRLVRLRSRLSRSQGTLGRGLLALLSRDTLDEAAWEEIEDTLLAADVGVAPTTELVERLRTRVRVLGSRTHDEVRALLREELLTLVDPTMDRTLHVSRHPAGRGAPAASGATAVGESGVVEGAVAEGATAAADDGGDRPAVVLVVGVNGVGKTTTSGKLARVLVADGHSVVLGAADTFRAAAVDQLQTWGDRVGAVTIRGPEGADPASVAFDAVRQGIDSGVDAVLIDTAGRLHTKTGLMDELGKVKRVVSRHGPLDEVLLVLDATTGQNGLVQARVFAEVVDITGIVLTKLDGSAKGGIVVAVQRELGVPVKLVGLGEGPDDLAPFDPEAFVDALIGD